jgi:hypothetical protein
VSTLDYEGMAEFFRTGRTIAERPPRFHRAIEQVTGQTSRVLPGGPGAADITWLSRGSTSSTACGAGRWLIAMARGSRVPSHRRRVRARSVARARGVRGRSRPPSGSRHATSPRWARRLRPRLPRRAHELPDPVESPAQ